MSNRSEEDHVVIKALEDGVTIIGLTRGEQTKFHHTEKLDAGEVMLAQFTKHTSAIKIRGEAKVITEHGKVTAGEIDEE
ncbi:trp RNA-binding attenuation protein MtrB [Sporohalobacter salinus]|uniref:trp RNA-binding attenuation protein MtrB n=1 Tax=Sporohalobacter salinus TaxID=1494606 RepID=UPI001960547C|nr:trp RNA-binding attenuation protein MtrB [Sporohalobacter salinus]MBM7622591.1 transcription attenuation protein (tryptophan RNA-binding attenuator protein) [Sporohalobacter salinus]